MKGMRQQFLYCIYPLRFFSLENTHAQTHKRSGYDRCKRQPLVLDSALPAAPDRKAFWGSQKPDWLIHNCQTFRTARQGEFLKAMNTTKKIYLSLHIPKLCVSIHTTNKHIYRSVDEIQRRISTRGCISYRQTMNQRKSTKTHARQRVCVYYKQCMHVCMNTNENLQMRTIIFRWCINAGAINLHYAPLSSHKKQEMRQDYNQGDWCSFIKPIKRPDYIWLRR